jgi:hypothetical protein
MVDMTVDFCGGDTLDTRFRGWVEDQLARGGLEGAASSVLSFSAALITHGRYESLDRFFGQPVVPGL